MSSNPEDPPTDFIGGLMRYLDSPKFQEMLRQEDATAEQFLKKLSVLAPLAQAFGAALSAPTLEYFERLQQSFADGERWADEAPQKLVAALAGEGLIPHGKALSLDDIQELTAVFDEKGSQAAGEHLHKLHEELLGLPEFRAAMRTRWERRGRWQVISEVLAAFDAKLYSVAIPPALAQAEGVVAHLFGLKDMRFDLFKQKVAELHAEEFDLLGPLTKKVLEGLLAKFNHGEPVAKLNRNAVMHGGDSTYGTRENAVAAIIWADYIMCTASDHKAIAIPLGPVEAAEVMAGRR
jgi:hypothetical protein